jgi:catechol 2,3-dioxygenase-like lactoylglutathione lyase family enzyme
MGGARLGPAVIPSLRARDLGETVVFYERLGFELRATHPQGEGARWCELSRDAARLHFHIMDLDGQLQTPALSGTLYFRTEDVRALAAQWGEKVTLAWGPEVMPYGWREFAIRDPNGYTLAFFEETTDPPDCPA